MLREGQGDVTGSRAVLKTQCSSERVGSSPTPGTKVCLGCKKEQPLDNFAPRRRAGRASQVVARCRPCDKAWRAEYERRRKAGELEPNRYLPVEPFRRFLEQRVAFYGTQGETALRMGMSDRRLHEVLFQSSRVTLDLVDRALIHEGSKMLWEVYPELYE